MSNRERNPGASRGMQPGLLENEKPCGQRLNPFKVFMLQILCHVGRYATRKRGARNMVNVENYLTMAKSDFRIRWGLITKWTKGCVCVCVCGEGREKAAA